jgi:hypothetical protein
LFPALHTLLLLALVVVEALLLATETLEQMVVFQYLTILFLLVALVLEII